MNMSVDRTRDFGEYVPAPDDDVIICRCEEITKGEIRRAVRDGMFNVHEVRRFLRCGMGLCQGQTCARLVRTLIARELGVPPGALIESGVEPGSAGLTDNMRAAQERGKAGFTNIINTGLSNGEAVRHRIDVARSATAGVAHSGGDEATGRAPARPTEMYVFANEEKEGL
jgi:bacterioferritin-associated ferredoxin